MSNQDPMYASQQGDTGTGFLVGTDPRKPPVTQQDLQPPQQTGQPPVTVVVNGQNGQPQGVRMFTEEEVGAIRAEEKTKLYDRMNAMDTELGQLRAEREERERLAAEERDRLAAEARANEEAALDVRQLMEKRDQEWSQRFNEMQSERERDLAIFEQERRFTQLQEYRRDRIEQEQEYLLPELRDLIQGSSPEEVDQAIEIMKQRTQAILASVQSAVTAQRGPIRGAAPTGAPSIGPMEQQSSTETLTVEQIKAMDNKTFAQYRDRLLGIASRSRFQQ